MNHCKILASYLLISSFDTFGILQELLFWDDRMAIRYSTSRTSHDMDHGESSMSSS